MSSGMIKPHGDEAIAHYEVVVAAHPERALVVTLDPARGWRSHTAAGFLAEWKPTGRLAIVVVGRCESCSTSGHTARSRESRRSR